MAAVKKKKKPVPNYRKKWPRDYTSKVKLTPQQKLYGYARSAPGWETDFDHLEFSMKERGIRVVCHYGRTKLNYEYSISVDLGMTELKAAYMGFRVWRREVPFKGKHSEEQRKKVARDQDDVAKFLASLFVGRS